MGEAGNGAKSRGLYIILGLFFGGWGVHNFYASRFGAGAGECIYAVVVLGLVFACGDPAVLLLMLPIWIWVLIELFTVRTDGYNRPMI